MKIKIMISILVLCMIFGMVASYAVSFTDLENSSEAYVSAIEKLSSKGVISGYPDETFKPANTITRAEMAKMVVTAFELKIPEQYAFEKLSDASSSWAEEFIDIAVANGIIKGYDDGTFRPSQSITYGETVAILVRLKNLKVDDTKEGEAWYTPYWKVASESGLFSDVGTNNFIAISPARRDNVALLIYNTLKFDAKKAEEKKNEEKEEPAKQDTSKEDAKKQDSQKETSKNESSTSLDDFNIDTNKIYFGVVDTKQLVRGRDFIEVDNFNDKALSLTVTNNSEDFEDGEVLFYKLRKSKGVNILEELKVADLDKAYVIEKLDDEEDGVFKIEGQSASFDISEDDYTFGENTVKLEKLSYFVIDASRKDGKISFKYGEESTRDSISFEEGDRIIVVPDKKLFVLVKGLV